MVSHTDHHHHHDFWMQQLIILRGPLVFSMLLSLLLWRAQPEQQEIVFTGVFSIVWLGCVVVTWQIRLLGGKM